MKTTITTFSLSGLPLILLSQLAWSQPAATDPDAPVPEPAPAEEVPEDEEAAADEATEQADATEVAEEPAAREEPSPEDETEETTDAEATKIETQEEGVSGEAQATEDEEAPIEEPAAEEAAAEPEAPSLLPLTIHTDNFIRPEIREGYDRLGVSRTRFQEGDFTVFRARFAIETNPVALTDGLSAVANFTPQASGVMGTTGIGGTIGEPNVGIYEGYFKLIGKRYDFKAGRFMMNYGDAMIIGNLGWHQTARSFDGIHGRYKMDKGYLDTFATWTAEGWPVSSEPMLAGDTLFWGAYAGIGGYLAEKMDLDLYFLGHTFAKTNALPDPEGGADYQREGATLFTLGARAKQKINFFDYRLEAGLQFGESPGAPNPGGVADAATTLAYHADGEVGVSFGKARVGAGGFFASGDDPTSAENEAWTDLYPTGHKWLGLMDVIGPRTNIAGANLALSAGLLENLKLTVKGHMFFRVEDGGLGRTGDDSYAGSEIDTGLGYKIGKYANVRGLYGIFLANDDHYASGEPAHYSEVQAGFKF